MAARQGSETLAKAWLAERKQPHEGLRGERADHGEAGERDELERRRASERTLSIDGSAARYRAHDEGRDGGREHHRDRRFVSLVIVRDLEDEEHRRERRVVGGRESRGGARRDERAGARASRRARRRRRGFRRTGSAALPDQRSPLFVIASQEPAAFRSAVRIERRRGASMTLPVRVMTMSPAASPPVAGSAMRSGIGNDSKSSRTSWRPTRP